MLERDLEVALRRFQRFRLQLRLLLQLVGEHQVVFHVLQRRQHRLAVGRRGLIGGGARLRARELALAAVEDRERQRWPERPEEIRAR